MSTLDITSRLHSLPQVVRALESPRGARAMGLWVFALCWMNSLTPAERSIPHSLVQRYDACDEDAQLLLDVGLWVEVAKREYEPIQFDSVGRPIWRPTPKPSRPAIPKAIRDAVFERDGSACVACCAPDDLTLDHIYPYVFGGPDTADNLRVLCRPCNSSKGARLP